MKSTKPALKKGRGKSPEGQLNLGVGRKKDEFFAKIKSNPESLEKSIDNDFVDPQQLIKVLQEAQKEVKINNVAKAEKVRKSISELNKISMLEIRRLSKMNIGQGSGREATPEKVLRFDRPQESRRQSVKEVEEDLKRYNTIMVPRVTNLRDNIQQKNAKEGGEDNANNLNEGIYKYLEELEKGKREKLGKQTIFQKIKSCCCCRRNEFEFIRKELKNLQKIRILYQSICVLNKEKKLKKAVRHFHDAINYRLVRNDIEMNKNLFINLFYYWQTNKFWQSWLFFLTLMNLIILPFIEPSMSMDVSMAGFDDSRFVTMFFFDLVFIIFVTIDIWIDFIQRHYDITRSVVKKFLKNRKFSLRAFVILMNLCDFMIFYTSYPNRALRFSRFLRPAYLYFYSKELRRMIKCIFLSVPHIIDLFIFYLIITSIWTFVGLKVIGDLEGEEPFDEYLNNFNNYFRALNAMYVLISFDGYPDIMIPSLNQNRFYLMFFVPYILAFLIIFIPIPVAIIFENFKNYRTKIAIFDRFKQREALFACFMSMEPEENDFSPCASAEPFLISQLITKEKFQELMKAVYKTNRITSRIEALTSAIDSNNSGKISIDEFFDVVDIVRSNQFLDIGLIKQAKWWKRLRTFMNNKFKFHLVVKHIVFSSFFFVLTLVNAGIMIAASILDDESETNDLLETIDRWFLLLYATEFMIKMIGLGVRRYFKDNWNLFDFSILWLSLITEFFLNVFQQFTSLGRQGRLLKIAKIQKVFRLMRVFRSMIRSLKVFNFLFFGFESLERVRMLFWKIAVCLPIIMKLLMVVYTVFYIYSVVGMELWNTEFKSFKEDSPYTISFTYTNFNSFGNVLLILIQICTESGWNYMIFDCAYKFESFALSCLYFDSFHMITIYIVFSLLRGLIWEVFSIIQEDAVARDGENLLLAVESSSSEEEEVADPSGDGHVDQDTGRKQSVAYSMRASKVNRMSKALSTVAVANLKNEEAPKQIREMDFTLNSFNEISLMDSPTNPKEADDDNIALDKPDEWDLGSSMRDHSYANRKSENLKNLLDLQSSNIEMEKNPFLGKYEHSNDDSNFLKELKPEKDLEKMNLKKEANYFKSSTTEIGKENHEAKRPGKSRPSEAENTGTKQTAQFNNNKSRKRYMSEERKDLSDTFSSQENDILELLTVRTKKDRTSKAEGQSDSNMKKHSQSKSSTKLKKYSEDEASLNTAQEQEFSRILIYKKRIKLLKYFNQRHINHKKEGLIANIFNEKYDCLDSEDDSTPEFLHKFLEKDFEMVYADASSFQMENLAKSKMNKDTNKFSKDEMANSVLGKQAAPKENRQSSAANNLNENMIIERAFLKDTNVEKLKNIELSYFSKKYGELFSFMREIDLTPTLDLSRKYVYYLNLLVKYTNVPVASYIRFLCSLEKKITKTLLKQGSFFKLIYHTSKGSWYTISVNVANQFSFIRLKDQGPWSFFSECFPEKKEIYIGRDIFKEFKSPELTKVLYELQQSLKPLASSFAKRYSKLSYEELIGDIFLIPYEFSKEQALGVKEKALEILEKNYKIEGVLNKEQPDTINAIDKVLVICFAMTGDLKSEENQKNELNRDARLLHMKTQEISNQLVGATSARNDGKTFKEKITLPFAFIVEMLKDINDIFTKNQLKMFAKLTEFLLLKQNPRLII